MKDRKTIDVDLLVFIALEHKPREIRVRVKAAQSEFKIIKEALKKGHDLVKKWKDVRVLNICLDFINYPEIQN